MDDELLKLELFIERISLGISLSVKSISYWYDSRFWFKLSIFRLILSIAFSTFYSFLLFEIEAYCVFGFLFKDPVAFEYTF